MIWKILPPLVQFCLMFFLDSCHSQKPIIEELRIGYYMRYFEPEPSFTMGTRFVKFECYPDTNRRLEFKEYNLKIYDRWGRKLFESNDPKEIWICKNDTLKNIRDATYWCLYDYVKADDTARHQAQEQILIQRIRK